MNFSKMKRVVEDVFNDVSNQVLVGMSLEDRDTVYLDFDNNMRIVVYLDVDDNGKEFINLWTEIY